MTAPPERGRANDAVLRLLARALSVPRRDLSIVSGPARREKIVELAGITQAELETRLTLAERKGERS